jgi:hypothetical protein
MTVTKTIDGWAVVDDRGQILQAGFASNAAAWRWADSNSGEALSPSQSRSHFGWTRYVNGD